MKHVVVGLSKQIDLLKSAFSSELTLQNTERLDKGVNTQVFVDCVFYGFYMSKQKLMHFALPQQFMTEAIPSSDTDRFNRQFSRCANMRRSRSRICSLNTLPDEERHKNRFPLSGISHAISRHEQCYR